MSAGEWRSPRRSFMSSTCWCSTSPLTISTLKGVQWLAEHVRARRCALVVVTHDRWFLDTVCTRTWEVVDGGVEQYDGGYSDWTFARAERARLADTADHKRHNLVRKELAWLRRGAPARTSKPQVSGRGRGGAHRRCAAGPRLGRASDVRQATAGADGH